MLGAHTEMWEPLSGRFSSLAAAFDLPRLMPPLQPAWRSLGPIRAEVAAATGVGETTRVLLRRVPWQILIRPGHAGDLQHVLALAEARGVPVVERHNLPYTCVGLIKPAGVP